jgi:hypothetical protein
MLPMPDLAAQRVYRSIVWEADPEAPETWPSPGALSAALSLPLVVVENAIAALQDDGFLATGDEVSGHEGGSTTE